MAMGSLGEALEREHQEIDAGLASFAEGLGQGETRTGPLLEAISALRRHIYLEEEMLFPPLRAAGMVAPVFVMVREHGEIWRAMDTLEAVAHAHTSTIPTDACSDLAMRLEAHNSKEETILYTQADGVLSGPASSELAAFMESGKMPEGWVCAGARITTP